MSEIKGASKPYVQQESNKNHCPQVFQNIFQSVLVFPTVPGCLGPRTMAYWACALFSKIMHHDQCFTLESAYLVEARHRQQHC